MGRPVAAAGIGRAADGLLAKPRLVLGALVAVQVATTILFAFRVPHNGWVYFQGGDQIWLSTTGWLLGQFELPPTEVGYGWPAVFAPITWVTGPTYVQALPAIIALQVLVLAPVALLSVYGIAARIGGRLLGYGAAALWIAAPYLAIPLFVERYHERWVDQFMPQALGLTAMADYASMVLLLVSALFVVRSLSPARVTDAALAGVILGFATGMKPPNALLAFGAGLAYVFARRWRELLVFGAALAPSVLVLALWKERGIGEIPALGLEAAHLAAGAALVAVDLPFTKYFELDIDHWLNQMDQLREFFWSARLAQWAPIAGVLAVARMRGSIAALLAGWLAAFIVVKGFSTRASIEDGSFWRLLMPAWPAYFLLVVSIPSLFPTLPRRLRDRLVAPEAGPIWRGWVAIAAVALIAVPAGAILASTPIPGPEQAVFQDDEGNTILTSVDPSLRLTTRREGDSQRLIWALQPYRADVFYRVYRTPGHQPDTECVTLKDAAAYCRLQMIKLGTTRKTTFMDGSPPPGVTYRVGVGTNYKNDPAAGDVFVLSPPVRAAP